MGQSRATAGIFFLLRHRTYRHKTENPSEGTLSESIRIGPNDPRYHAVVDKRFNKRFGARPDYVRLVSSTDQVVSAVEEEVEEGRRLVVTSGGHCLEGFVSDPEVRVIIDTSPMKRVYYDAGRRTVAVEVVTVDEAGRASSVVATRERSDPHRDLWWAYTGGGGGNFGAYVGACRWQRRRHFTSLRESSENAFALDS